MKHLMKKLTVLVMTISLSAFAETTPSAVTTDKAAIGQAPESSHIELTSKKQTQPIIATIPAEKNPHRGWIWETETEPFDTGWALYVDNDLFALSDSDKDYTGGISLTLSGKRATEYTLSLDPALNWIDRVSGFQQLIETSDRHLHSLEIGFTVFTPEVITERSAQLDDRPYASLLFLANTHEAIDFADDSAFISSFSIGVLGSKLVSEAQSQVHKIFGSDQPVGWEHQISHGGELTARYNVAKQSLFYFDYQSENNLEISTTQQASIGYITEVSFGLAARIGDFKTPWYSFRPQFNDYSEKSASLAGIKQATEEFYFWGGFNLHLRAYNAFLQGQFKDSEHVYRADELRVFVADAWLGLTKQFESGWRLSYLLRGQSSEVNTGKADRNELWGGFILSKGW